jgi:hypothetical protein
LLRTALIGALCALCAAPAAHALEDGLFGVRIGASFRELTQKFGPPHGIVFPSMIFQTVAPSPMAGLPSFGQPGPTETPVWVVPIRPTSLEPAQTEWVYDFRAKRGIALGVVLTGEGADAMVTDIIVAGFPQNLKGKPAPVRTGKGVALQSTFEDVLKRYGYPPLIEIYAPLSGGAAAGRGGVGGAMQARGGARGAMRAGGGGRAGAMRGRGRGGAFGGRRRAAAPGLGRMTARSESHVVLTGMRGGGRGGAIMRGGGGRRAALRAGGGRRAGARAVRGRAGALPPLGAAAPVGAAEQFTATAVVNHQTVSFSRDCTIVYEGIAFTLHDLKVFRIHVSE